MLNKPVHIYRFPGLNLIKARKRVPLGELILQREICIALTSVESSVSIDNRAQRLLGKVIWV